MYGSLSSILILVVDHSPYAKLHWHHMLDQLECLDQNVPTLWLWSGLV